MDDTRTPAPGQAFGQADDAFAQAEGVVSGHVEATPEAEPLDSLDLRVAPPPASGGDEPAALPPPTPLRPGLDDQPAGGGFVERLKPVTAAAEDVAAAAVSLSAKGLSRLAALLDERRQRRGGQDG